MSDVNLPPMAPPPGDLFMEPVWPKLAVWAVEYATRAVFAERERAIRECEKWSSYWQHPGFEERREAAELIAAAIRGE